jgi:hypothetical protein
MGWKRHLSHRDANEPKLLAAAAKCGALWVQAGPLDGWVRPVSGRYPRQWIPVEIKNPDGKNRYEKSQIEFMDLCNAIGAPYFTWRTTDDVVCDLT